MHIPICSNDSFLQYQIYHYIHTYKQSYSFAQLPAAEDDDESLLLCTYSIGYSRRHRRKILSNIVSLSCRPRDDGMASCWQRKAKQFNRKLLAGIKCHNFPPAIRRIVLKSIIAARLTLEKASFHPYVLQCDANYAWNAIFPRTPMLLPSAAVVVDSRGRKLLCFLPYNNPTAMESYAQVKQ